MLVQGGPGLNAKQGSVAYHNNGNMFSLLTHWGQDKMAAILQTTFWNAFSSMKTVKLHHTPLSQRMMILFTDTYMRISALEDLNFQVELIP